MKPDRPNQSSAGWLALSVAVHLLVLTGLALFGIPASVQSVPENSMMATLVTLPAEPPARQPAVTVRARRVVPEKKIKVRPVRPITEVPVATDRPGPAETARPVAPLSNMSAAAGQPDPSIRIPHDILMNGAGRDARRTSVGKGSESEPEAFALPPGWLSEVRDRIERAKRYPWTARIRGLEGTSLVRFRISVDGAVRDVAVRRSSAHKILDEAAVRTVERAAPFPGLPAELADENIEINIPLVFELH
jgi:protein TonB